MPVSVRRHASKCLCNRDLTSGLMAPTLMRRIVDTQLYCWHGQIVHLLCGVHDVGSAVADQLFLIELMPKGAVFSFLSD